MFGCSCQQQNNYHTPYIMSPLQSAPLLDVSIVFKQLSHTRYLLVIIDDYSRYPMVESANSTSSHHVIPGLDKIFSIF